MKGDGSNGNGNAGLCPRCSCLVSRDGWDLYCFTCGWRDSFALVTGKKFAAIYEEEQSLVYLMHQGKYLSNLFPKGY